MSKATKGTGAERIAAERTRQVAVEGWTAEHDDEHADGDMAMAAVCYASCAVGARVYEQREYAAAISFEDPWPWEARWDGRPYDGNVLKPQRATKKQRIRMLEKAGALIAAEIDRLLRAAPAQQKEPR